jgi:hypothetical protein
MSTLVIDTIQGKTTAGSVNVRGEGSNNTNLQQGLAKSWCVFNGTGTVAISDSLNSASLTDVATGDYTLGFVSNMASVNYAVSGSSVGSSAANYYNMLCGDGANNTTSLYEINFIHRSDTTGQIDNDHAATIVHGDLT